MLNIKLNQSTKSTSTKSQTKSSPLSSTFIPRTSRPTKTNKYYITKKSGGYSTCVQGKCKSTGKPDKQCDTLSNCVGYANGRFNELIGKDKEVYPLNCHAEKILERAKSLGLKTGSTPKLGSIICFSKGSAATSEDGCGHVGIVEKILSKDTIVISQSGYGSTEFWNETLKKSNSWKCSWMDNSYKFQAFIYLPDNIKYVAGDYLKVNGIWDCDTTTASQIMFGLNPDGKISNQPMCNKKYITGTVDGWCFKTSGYQTGSNFVRKVQSFTGMSKDYIDGFFGKGTIIQLQSFLADSKKNKRGKFYTGNVDGILDKSTIKAWQKFVNEYFKSL